MILHNKLWARFLAVVNKTSVIRSLKLDLFTDLVLLNVSLSEFSLYRTKFSNCNLSVAQIQSSLNYGAYVNASILLPLQNTHP